MGPTTPVGVVGVIELPWPLPATPTALGRWKRSAVGDVMGGRVFGLAGRGAARRHEGRGRVPPGSAAGTLADLFDVPKTVPTGSPPSVGNWQPITCGVFPNDIERFCALSSVPCGELESINPPAPNATTGCIFGLDMLQTRVACACAAY